MASAGVAASSTLRAVVVASRLSAVSVPAARFAVEHPLGSGSLRLPCPVPAILTPAPPPSVTPPPTPRRRRSDPAGRRFPRVVEGPRQPDPGPTGLPDRQIPSRPVIASPTGCGTIAPPIRARTDPRTRRCQTKPGQRPPPWYGGRFRPSRLNTPTLAQWVNCRGCCGVLPDVCRLACPGRTSPRASGKSWFRWVSGLRSCIRRHPPDRFHPVPAFALGGGRIGSVPQRGGDAAGSGRRRGL